MRLWRSVITSVAFLVACVVALPVYAQNDGAVPLRIVDGPDSRCINPQKDMVWLTLRRVITEKRGSWLVENKSVATIFKAIVNSSAMPVTFPLAAEATLGPYAKGQVSVPIEYGVVSGLKLKQSNVTYRGIQLEMTFLNLDKKTGWGTALQVLSEVAKKIPLPSTPLAQAGSYLLEFANSAVNKDVEKVASSDKATSASLALNFDPTGNCKAHAPDGTDFEQTGTIAVLYGSGDATGFLVPVKQVNQFCWDAELKPAFVLKAAKKDAAACTDKTHYKDLYRQVSNNYVGYFLNAVEVTDQLAETPIGVADREKALQRCRANGKDDSACLTRAR